MHFLDLAHHGYRLEYDRLVSFFSIESCSKPWAVWSKIISRIQHKLYLSTADVVYLPTSNGVVNRTEGEIKYLWLAHSLVTAKRARTSLLHSFWPWLRRAYVIRFQTHQQLAGVSANFWFADCQTNFGDQGAWMRPQGFFFIDLDAALRTKGALQWWVTSLKRNTQVLSYLFPLIYGVRDLRIL